MNFLPWVSRRAFDEVCGERDLLRNEKVQLIAELVGLTRVRHGLREKRKEERPPPEPVPEEIRALINRWESASSRRQMMLQVNTLRKRGRDWPEIEKILTASISAA